MPFCLMHDSVAVIADEVSETTASGLIVAESAQNPLRYGVVTHVGSGSRSPYTGEKMGSDIAEGDRIFFNRFSGQTLTIDGEEVLILGINEVIGVIDA